MKRKIIDSHMHLAQWVADNGESIFDNLEKYQKMGNIAAVDNMACTNNGDLWNRYEADQSILGAIVKLHNPTVFSHGCLFIPKGSKDFKILDFKGQLDDLMEIGLDGIKICDFKPDAYKLFNVDAHLEEYDDFISYCEKNGVHMCWHVADPDPFWKTENGPYLDGTFPTYESLNEMTYKFLDSHPNLNVLLAHMFFKSFDPAEAEMILKKYPNACFDMAPGWEMFSGFKKHHGEWSRIFREYSTRFLYATDMTFPMGTDYAAGSANLVLKFLETDEEFDVRVGHSAKGIKLEEEYLENILYKNHDRTVGKTPKEINKAALKKYIQRYLPYLPDTRNKQKTEEFLLKNL